MTHVDGRALAAAADAPSLTSALVPSAAALAQPVVEHGSAVAGLGTDGWTLEPTVLRRARRRMSDDEWLKAGSSHGSFQDYKREAAAAFLAEALPQSLVDCMVAGSGGVEMAIRQVPDPAQRREGLRTTILVKAGPDGSALGKARRALEELVAFQPRGHLPASAILLNRLIEHVGAQATARNRGSQGGATVKGTIRSGLLTLMAIGFPVDAKHLSVDAAAPPGLKRTRERRSASLPLAFYFHFEELASSATDSFARFYARSLVVCWLYSSLRLVDVLRASIAMNGIDEDGCPVIRILTHFSKDGAPLDVYLRAEGFLGPWSWAVEHVAALKDRPYVLPEFLFTKGHAGDILYAYAWLSSPQPRVVSKAHAITSLKSLSASAPLEFTKAVWDKIGIGPHSGHGSPSDIIATFGVNPEIPLLSFLPADEQEAGHWRRRATSSHGGGELPLDPELQAALQQRPGAAPAAMTAEDAAMRVRYTSGENRHGRRTAQLRVRRRLVFAVRHALRVFGAPWRDLLALVRECGSDYSVIRAAARVPPAHVA